MKDMVENLEFYGNMDKDVKGNIQSMYPAWYCEQFLNELNNQIDQMENSVRMGFVPQGSLPEHNMILEQNRQKRDDILASKPRPSQGERDRLQKAYKELGKIISDTMYTRSEMQMGLADAHTEAKFMSEHVIPVPKTLEDLFKAAQAKTEKGKATRNAFAKVFKVIGKLIDEPTNIEVLRRDKATGRRPGSKKGIIH